MKADRSTDNKNPKTKADDRLSFLELRLRKNMIDLSVVNLAALEHALRWIKNYSPTNIMDLSAKEIDLDKLRLIIDFLINHPLFTNLTLEGWQASLESLKIVAQGLQHSPTLRHIDFSCLELQEERFDALAEVLFNKNIKSANLRGNYPSLASLRTLSQRIGGHPSLITLILSSCQLGDEAITLLASDFMQKGSALKNLNLSHNMIGPEGAQALSQMLLYPSQVMHLNLANNRLGVSGASALSTMLLHNQQLIHLNLSNNNIGDLGMTDLAIALRKNSTLTALYCDENSITYAGAAEIMYTVRKNITLKEIGLSMNLIHEQFITLYEKIKKIRLKNPSQTEPAKICEFNLWHNKAAPKLSVSVPWLLVQHKQHEKRLGKLATVLLKFSRIILTASQINDGDKTVSLPLEVKELILQQLDVEQILTTTQTKNIFRYAADRTTLFASSTKDHFLSSVACDRVMKPYALNFKD